MGLLDSVRAAHGELVTPAIAAGILHTTVASLSQRRARRDGPPYVKDGRRVLYPLRDLEDYLNRGRRGDALIATTGKVA